MRTFKVVVLTLVVANILLFVAILPKREKSKTKAPTLPTVATNAGPEAPDTNAAVNTALNSYRQTFQQLAETHGLRIKTLEAADVLNMKDVGASDDLQNRIALVREFQSLTRDYLKALEDPEAVFSRALAENGITEETRARELARFHPGISNRDHLVELRRQELEIAEAQTEVLAVLLTNWGKWVYRSNLSRVAFDRASALKDYDAAMEKIRAVDVTAR
jgi:hypothetical protein